MGQNLNGINKNQVATQEIMTFFPPVLLSLPKACDNNPTKQVDILSATVSDYVWKSETHLSVDRFYNFHLISKRSINIT